MVFKADLVNFYNSKNDQLSAILNVADKTKLVVIICHGFGSDKEGTSKDIANALEEIGINSFRFDFWAHGESDGKFEDITITEGVDDIIKAHKYLIQKGFTKIGLLGNSYGGACSLIAASKIPNLKFLALLSPVAEYIVKELMTKTKEELLDWKERGYRIYKNNKGEERIVNYSFFEDMKINSGYEAAYKIPYQTFIVHGSKDETVPLILSEILTKIINNSTLEVVEGADHRYSDPELDKKAINKLIRFIKKFN